MLDQPTLHKLDAILIAAAIGCILLVLLQPQLSGYSCDLSFFLSLYIGRFCFVSCRRKPCKGQSPTILSQ